MPNEESKQENISTTMQIELITKVVDNANAVSGAIRLLGENIEELSQASDRLENKFDSLEKTVTEYIESVNKSGVIKFFTFIRKGVGSLIAKFLSAIFIPFIIFIFFIMIYGTFKGWPYVLKILRGG